MSENINYNEENTARRLAIWFNIDASTSMGIYDGGKSTKMERLNKSVKRMLKELCEEPRIASGGEVGFGLFSDHVDVIGFRPIKEVVENFKPFKPTGDSTKLSLGLKAAYENISKRQELYKDRLGKGRWYTPIVITVTDGNPYRDDNAVLEIMKERVKEHCTGRAGENLIIPYFVMIGQRVNESVIRGYTAGFNGGMIRITDDSDMDKFHEAFKALVYSVTGTIDLNNLDGVRMVQMLNERARALFGEDKFGAEGSLLV